MKRYEKMGLNTDKVLEVITSGGRCETCIALNTKACVMGGGCTLARARALNQDIKTVPRIATINTKEEIADAYTAFSEHCGDRICNEECKYWRHRGDHTRPRSCFANYLAEEIEVEND